MGLLSRTEAGAKRPGAARPRSWLPLAAFVLLVVVTLACYRPGLGGPLLLDDEVQLPPIIGAVDVGNWHARAPDFLISGTGPAGRPVSMVSLLASVIAHGSDIRAYKRENSLLHLLCGVLIFAWVLALQRAFARLDGQGEPEPWRPMFAAALWLLHPLMVSTVLYTVQRMTILSTLFTLAGLLAYTAGREAQLQGRARQGAVLLIICLAVCLPLAVFSKENGILLLPICLALELTVFAGAGTLRQRRAVRAMFGLLLVLPALLAATVFLPQIIHYLAAGFANREFSFAERLLTEARVVLFYLLEWFVPSPRNLSFYHDDFAISRNWWDPWSTAPAVAVVLALTGLAVWLVRRKALVGLGLLIFLIGHSLEATVVPLELVFEHRNYLPDVGLALALAMLPWHRILTRDLAMLPVRIGLSLLALLVLATLTFQRCEAWSSRDVLLPSLFDLNPDSPRLVALFANSYANGGQFEVSRELLARQHTVGARLQQLDLDCLARREFEPARLDAAVAQLRGPMGPYEVQELVLLVNDALEQKCGLPLIWGETLIDRALGFPITQPGSRQLLWLYRGHLDHASNRSAAAQEDLQRSAQSDPSNPLPLLLATDWALQSGDIDLARARFAAALGVTGPHRAEYHAMYEGLDGRLRATSR